MSEPHSACHFLENSFVCRHGIETDIEKHYKPGLAGDDLSVDGLLHFPLKDLYPAPSKEEPSSTELASATSTTPTNDSSAQVPTTPDHPEIYSAKAVMQVGAIDLNASGGAAGDIKGEDVKESTTSDGISG